MTTNQGYVQTRCPRCGAGAWALSTYAVPCQSCGTPVGPVGAAPAAAAFQAPAANGGYGGSAAAANGGYGGAAAANGGYGGAAAVNGGYGGAPAANGGYGGAAAANGGYGGNGFGANGFGANGFGANAGAGGYQAPAPAYQGAPAPMPQPAPAAAAPPVAPSVGHNFAVNVGGFKIPLKLGGGAGGVSKAKVFGAIGLAIALAIGGVFVKMKLGTTVKGNLSYASLGVDAKKPDADTLIANLGKPATRWKRDAMWWSANFQAVDADGKVDVAKGAEVVYISESAVQSHAKSVRKDSIKKYRAGMAGVSHKDLWGATEPWQGIERHPVPKCTIKDVMALVGKDLPKGKTVRVTFDPKFAEFYAWRVMSDELKIDTLYAFEDCAIIK